MSAERAPASRVERDLRAAESLYVVRVQDHIDGRLAGHDGCIYVSPPASRDSALTLVGLLLGGDPRPANGSAAWTHAVPGGRRTTDDHARARVRSDRLSAGPRATARQGLLLHRCLTFTGR